ncbi:MAG: insulinase family protein [Bacteroidota bacterium]
MKKTAHFLLIVIFAFISQGGFAQTDMKAPLPVDQNIVMGKLENGLTYYIMHNETPKNRAELTLIVRAGSINEDEDQRGLAHFCEHMAFNGSKHYPKHELINYLESLGMKFGPEVNAYTSFDETVYGIKVPLDSAEYLDKGLLVMYDWASGVSFEDEEIDKERGIIHEEWRMNQGAQFRTMEKMLPVLFNGSKYAERIPIGLMKVVDSCDYEVLKKFYYDWYRPDLQALVLVGDFDVNEVEGKVKKLFSEIPKRENSREALICEIPDHMEPLISIVSDKEAQATSVQIFYKHPLWTMKNHQDYRESIIHSLYNGMINNRLSELTTKENPPFAYGYSVYTSFLGPKDVYMSLAATQDAKIMEGMTALMVENERVKRYGFTQTELDREKKAVLRQVEKLYNERDKRKSNEIVEEIKQNFLLTQTPIPGIEYEFNLYKEFLPGITLEEVNKLADKWITGENMVVLVNAPEKETVVLPKEEDISKLIGEVKNMTIEPYVDKVSDKPFFAEELTPGKVEGKVKNKEAEYEEWTLKNGIKVILKQTDFKQDEILFSAYSLGGTSKYPVDQDVSARIACDIITESGISEFDKTELDKIMSDKVVRVSPFISDLTEGFRGNCAPQDFETMLQMIHMYFTKVRYDKTAYGSYIERMKSLYENQSLSPENVFRDSIQAIMSQNHPKKRPISDKLLDEADFKTVYKIYKERFGDPSSFTFFFVGNIDLKVAKPLIEKYLGGLPLVNREESYVDLGIEPPSGVILKDVKMGSDPKSVVFMNLHGPFEYDWKNSLEVEAISTILGTKLLETIREDKSGVYSIGAYPQTRHYPKALYDIVVYFGCSPENVEPLTEAVFEEINKLKKDGPSEVDLNKVKEKLMRERETNLRENRFWLNTIQDRYLHGGNFEDLTQYDEAVQSLTIESLKATANKYFNEKNYLRVVLLPEEK